PPYAALPQSFLPTRIGEGSRVEAPSVSSVVDGGMSNRTQCTHTILGAAGSGASGSSTMRARLLVPGGIPVHARGGETSVPSQVSRFGIGPRLSNADELSVSDMVTV